MFLTQSLALILISTLHLCYGSPSYHSLGGLSQRDQDAAVEKLYKEAVYPPDLPPPMAFNGTKLVHDEAHPWMPLREGDIRGPCPGLNTLASHGVRGPLTSINLSTMLTTGDHSLVVLAS